jgi:hypothetical protein
MSLKLVTVNVNGLRDNRKRELVFNWLVSKKYDCICLQETHCKGVDINRWESEWKTQGDGASAWSCGSSESKGVAILLSKHFAFDINFNFSDKTGRLLTVHSTYANILKNIYNQRLPGACNRSPGLKLLSITTQLHCGGHLGGRAQLPDTILEEDHPMTIPSKFGFN